MYALDLDYTLIIHVFVYMHACMSIRELEIIGRSGGCCSVRIIEECAAIMSVAMTLLENNWDN